MPDSPKVKNRDNNHSEDDSEVELVEETQKQKNSLSSTWPQTLQDMKNNNSKPVPGQPFIYPRF